MGIAFNVFAARDNVEEIHVFAKDGTLMQDLSGLTGVDVVIAGVTFDSSSVPADTIFWSDSRIISAADVSEDSRLAPYLGQSSDVLSLRLGNSIIDNSVVEFGKHKKSCIALKTLADPDGVVWDANITVTVAGCEE